MDDLGGVYVSGFTEGDLEGASSGGNDIFVRKYDTDGNAIWTTQLGTGSDDHAYGVSADGVGGVYFVGHTEGDLAGENVGNWDAFVGRIPEPLTSAMLLLGVPVLLSRSRRKAS